MKKFLCAVGLLGAFTANAQLTLDSEFRPRFEVRNGYRNLTPKDADAATFTSQRTRLNVGFKNENINSYLSLQNISIWGDTPQLTSEGANGTYLHQAWVDVKLNEQFSTKVGRQEINYDDARILGNVGWAQQARSHDAFLLKYKKDKLSMDVGLAYNQNSMNGSAYDIRNYKSLQYVWLHKDFQDFSGSFLFLNNGLQFIDQADASKNETRYSQTVGTHLKGKSDKLAYNANAYYQFGKDKMNNELSAYLVGLNLTYNTSANTKLILGGEIQSGNAYDREAKTNNAFTPFYGTNHKFNGFMDYFYVGNHVGSVGLTDVYLKGKFKLNEKSGLLVAVHNFMSSAKMAKDQNNQLGNELDLLYSYKLNKDVKISAGYSHMFASDGMEVLRGIKNEGTNNYALVTLTVKPTLFTTKKK